MRKTGYLIVAAGLFTMAFGAIAEGIAPGGWLLAFDARAATDNFQLGLDNAAVRRVLRVRYRLRRQPGVNLFVGGLALVLVVRRQYALALLLVATALGNRELNIWLKDEFARIRPEFAPEELRLNSYSFPSGHAQSAAFCYGFAIYFGVLGYPKWKLPIGLILTFLIVGVAWSRMVLGVHFASDVLAGCCVAAAELCLLFAIVERVRRTRTSQELESPVPPAASNRLLPE